MGCDVHAVWQAKKEGKWVDVASLWDQDRHYFLFSWLAGVRNGYGFAGVPTYTPVKPIAEPRGYPEDFDVEDDYHAAPIEAVDPRRAQWKDDDDKLPDGRYRIWLGDHTHSWLSADEILATPSPDKVWRTGIVERAVFDSWDGHTPPKKWSGGISGAAIRVAEAPTEVKEESTHVRIWWLQPGDELKYFTDEVRRLKDEHGDVRVVFGFDS